MNNEDTDTLLSRLLDTIQHDILPLTTSAVAQGNKIFGAALLRKSDLSTFLAETNNEMENPLWHGEIHTLKRFYEIPAEQRPAPSELLFLSTHEPCSLCLSAITWAGFDNFYYFFSHEDSRDAFAIPHDLKILKEVFDVEPGKYRHNNEFWSCYSIRHLAASSSTPNAYNDRIQDITRAYTQLSDHYQHGKGGNPIPLS